jgi:hypothetical protein
MKLDDLISEWATDSNIDTTQIISETVRTANLHAKYMRYLSNERLRYEKSRQDRNVLIHLKTDYYLGELDFDTLKEKGWKPNPRKIMKVDLDRFLNADEHIVKINLDVALQKEKVDALVEIVKAINNRSYSITNIIAWSKFQAGVN